MHGTGAGFARLPFHVLILRAPLSVGIGASYISDEDLDDLLDIYIDAGVPMPDVPVEAARGAFMAAEHLARRRGQRLSPTLELWAPVFYDAWPPTGNEDIIVPMLDNADFAGSRARARVIRSLLDSPWFAPWIFNIDATSNAMQSTVPLSAGRGRTGSMVR